MRHTPRLLLVIAALACAPLAHAEIFVCEVDGHKSYSQLPCGNDAKSVQLSNGTDGNITAGANVTPDSALATCKLMFRGIEIASRLAHERIPMQAASQRVVGFIKEHITNFDDIVHQNPSYYGYIQNGANIVTRLGYTSANPTDDEINAATAQCTQGMLNDAQRNGGTTRSITPQKRTSDKMI